MMVLTKAALTAFRGEIRAQLLDELADEYTEQAEILRLSATTNVARGIADAAEIDSVSFRARARDIRDGLAS